MMQIVYFYLKKNMVLSCKMIIRLSSSNDLFSQLKFNNGAEIIREFGKAPSSALSKDSPAAVGCHYFNHKSYLE